MSTPEGTRRRRPRQPPPKRRTRTRAAAPVPAPKPMSETTLRVLWAIPWAAFAITIIVAGGGIFAVAIALIAAVCIGELFNMARGTRPFVGAAILTCFAVIAAAYFGDQFQMVLAFALGFPIIFVFVLLRGRIEGVTMSVAVTVLGIAWIAIPFAHAVLLRELPDHGGALLVDVLVATIVADTAAYMGGRAFGRHPLSPEISPNKTIEGLAFGVLGGIAGFWFAGLYQDWLPGTDALIMGAVIAVVAPIGDLFESMVKRDLRVKDSGTAVGPHGGLLDRLDAVLFTLVAGYYLSIWLVY